MSGIKSFTLRETNVEQGIVTSLMLPCDMYHEDCPVNFYFTSESRKMRSLQRLTKLVKRLGNQRLIRDDEARELKVLK